MRTSHLKTILTTLILLLIFAINVHAQVKGQCVNCHTMHNSQDNLSVLAGGVDLQPALTVDTCVGCHTNSTSAETIVDLGDGTRIPIVYNSNHEPTYPPTGTSSSALAGGNFYWIAQGDDSKGHNVYGISAADMTLTAGAPGQSAFCSPCHDTLATEDSGCVGCHVPRHHADDSATIVDASAGSFRYLGDMMYGIFGFGTGPSGNGVMGIEDANWEQNPSSTQHNTYAGTDVAYTHAAMGPFLSYSSMGQFCAGCHGKFHHSMNSAQSVDLSVSGAWIRHPSDVVIPDDFEYQDYTVYNPLAPAAKPSITAGMLNSPDVVPGTDLVTCISCHRPHGSPYPDMLRWDYDTCETASGNTDCGCFVCHTTKD